MPHRRPEKLARDAALLLAGGFTALTVFALIFYRADGPRWPHHVVDGLTWIIVVTAGAMLAVAAAELLLDIARRHRSH
ncbi:MAG: hypothetical protein ABWZ87_10810 [Aeromicrobium sp.]